MIIYGSMEQEIRSKTRIEKHERREEKRGEDMRREEREAESREGKSQRECDPRLW